MNELFELYNSRFDEPFSTKRYREGRGGQSHSLREWIEGDLYRSAKGKDEDDWQLVGDLQIVRNPLMKGLRREVWWDRDSGDDPIGDLRISRQTVNQGPRKGELHSVEVIRAFPDGSSVPFIFDVNGDGSVSPVKINEENYTRLMKCISCHSGESGHFARVINLKGYEPSPDWRIDEHDHLFPQYKPYSKEK